MSGIRVVVIADEQFTSPVQSSLSEAPYRAQYTTALRFPRRTNENIEGIPILRGRWRGHRHIAGQRELKCRAPFPISTSPQTASVVGYRKLPLRRKLLFHSTHSGREQQMTRGGQGRGESHMRLVLADYTRSVISR